MNTPEQQQIDHWLKTTPERIQRTWELNNQGFYVKEEISLQSVHQGVAGWYASLARAQYLNGDP